MEARASIHTPSKLETEKMRVLLPPPLVRFSSVPSSVPSSVSSLGAPPPPPLFHQPNPSFPRRGSSLTMRLVPCSARQASLLAPKRVTTEQWQAYWGLNKMERLQKVLESLLLAYGGAWFSWFLSLVSASVGAVLSSFAGTALVFNWMYAPYLYARSRNAKLWPSSSSSSRGGGSRLYYALYVGRIVALKRIKRRAGKTVGAVAQEYLVMDLRDEEGRDLEIITQWQVGACVFLCCVSACVSVSTRPLPVLLPGIVREVAATDAVRELDRLPAQGFFGAGDGDRVLGPRGGMLGGRLPVLAAERVPGLCCRGVGRRGANRHGRR